MSEYAISTLFGSPAPDFMYISASAPDAPPLSDTTIGCFIRLFFWIAACIMRAIWSEAPPAPAATTISTGFVGSQPAIAGALASMADSTAADFMIFRTCFLPYVFDERQVRTWSAGRPCTRQRPVKFKQAPTALMMTFA